MGKAINSSSSRLRQLSEEEEGGEIAEAKSLIPRVMKSGGISNPIRKVLLAVQGNLIWVRILKVRWIKKKRQVVQSMCYLADFRHFYPMVSWCFLSQHHQTRRTRNCWFDCIICLGVCIYFGSRHRMHQCFVSRPVLCLRHFQAGTLVISWQESRGWSAMSKGKKWTKWTFLKSVHLASF